MSAEELHVREVLGSWKLGQYAAAICARLGVVEPHELCLVCEEDLHSIGLTAIEVHRFQRLQAQMAAGADNSAFTQRDGPSGGPPWVAAPMSRASAQPPSNPTSAPATPSTSTKPLSWKSKASPPLAASVPCALPLPCALPHPSLTVEPRPAIPSPAPTPSCPSSPAPWRSLIRESSNAPVPGTTPNATGANAARQCPALVPQLPQQLAETLAAPPHLQCQSPQPPTAPPTPLSVAPPSATAGPASAAPSAKRPTPTSTAAPTTSPRPSKTTFSTAPSLSSSSSAASAACPPFSVAPPVASSPNTVIFSTAHSLPPSSSAASAAHPPVSVAPPATSSPNTVIFSTAHSLPPSSSAASTAHPPVSVAPPVASSPTTVILSTAAQLPWSSSSAASAAHPPVSAAPPSVPSPKSRLSSMQLREPWFGVVQPTPFALPLTQLQAEPAAPLYAAGCSTGVSRLASQPPVVPPAQRQEQQEQQQQQQQEEQQQQKEEQQRKDEQQDEQHQQKQKQQEQEMQQQQQVSMPLAARDSHSQLLTLLQLPVPRLKVTAPRAPLPQYSHSSGALGATQGVTPGVTAVEGGLPGTSAAALHSIMAVTVLHRCMSVPQVPSARAGTAPHPFVHVADRAAPRAGSTLPATAPCTPTSTSGHTSPFSAWRASLAPDALHATTWQPAQARHCTSSNPNFSGNCSTQPPATLGDSWSVPTSSSPANQGHQQAGPAAAWQRWNFQRSVKLSLGHMPQEQQREDAGQGQGSRGAQVRQGTYAAQGMTTTTHLPTRLWRQHLSSSAKSAHYASSIPPSDSTPIAAQCASGNSARCPSGNLHGNSTPIAAHASSSEPLWSNEKMLKAVPLPSDSRTALWPRPSDSALSTGWAAGLGSKAPAPSYPSTDSWHRASDSAFGTGLGVKEANATGKGAVGVKEANPTGKRAVGVKEANPTGKRAVGGKQDTERQAGADASTSDSSESRDDRTRRRRNAAPASRVVQQRAHGSSVHGVLQGGAYQGSVLIPAQQDTDDSSSSCDEEPPGCRSGEGAAYPGCQRHHSSSSKSGSGKGDGRNGKGDGRSGEGGDAEVGSAASTAGAGAGGGTEAGRWSESRASVGKLHAQPKPDARQEDRRSAQPTSATQLPDSSPQPVHSSTADEEKSAAPHLPLLILGEGEDAPTRHISWRQPTAFVAGESPSAPTLGFDASPPHPALTPHSSWWQREVAVGAQAGAALQGRFQLARVPAGVAPQLSELVSGGIVRLDLSGINLVGPSALAVACAVAVCPSLEVLRLDSCSLSSHGAAAVAAAAARSKALHTLSLCCNGLRNSCLPHLMAALQGHSSLAKLQLRGNAFSQGCAAPLGSLIQALPCLSALNLRGNRIRDLGCAQLLVALQPTRQPAHAGRPRQHSTAYSQGSEQGLAAEESGRAEQDGSVGDPEQQPAGGTCAAEPSVGSSCCGAGCAAESVTGAPSVTAGEAGSEQRLRQPGIHCGHPWLGWLCLSRTGMGPSGAAALARWLSLGRGACRLHTLYLGENAIQDSGVTSLAAALALPDCPLALLDLHNNSVGPVGTSSLADALSSNTQLTYLDLSSNQIGWQGAAAMAAALHTNIGLAHLNLWNNGIRQEGRTALAAAVAQQQQKRAVPKRPGQESDSRWDPNLNSNQRHAAHTTAAVEWQELEPDLAGYQDVTPLLPWLAESSLSTASAPGSLAHGTTGMARTVTACHIHYLN